MMQFSLISLVPGLLRNLQDSAGPDMNSYEKRLSGQRVYELVTGTRYLPIWDYPYRFLAR